VGVRALVFGVDADDFGVTTWKSTLDRVGSAYDVLLARSAPLTAESLVRPDGAGRYNAILLSNNSLLYNAGTGFVSALSAEQWNTLWAYERTYGVRQAALYAAPGTWPEDYCLQASSEGAVGETAVQATLTDAGAPVFDYLRRNVKVPISQSYVYRTAIKAGCAAQPILQIGTDVVGALTTSADGRERAAFTFTSNQNLLQAEMLGYGLFRWASRGLFLGEFKHYLNVDVDDWFNRTAHYQIPGQPASSPYFQLTGAEAANVVKRQKALRSKYAVADGFTFTMAYNGGNANLAATPDCSGTGDVAGLTAATLCMKDKVYWINHTRNHPALNTTDYATTYAQINDNTAIGLKLGLDVDDEILKTPEYSGLGVYSADPTDTIDPPTDHGLAASNPALIKAATDIGVKYLHGNMSFPSHRPANFNGAVVHPLAPNLSVIPDWPTNIAYHTSTPEEQTAYYNSYYGPGGLFPRWSRDLTYPEVISAETDVALHHLTSGSIYAHTFHIANLHDYGSGKTLVTDFLDDLIGKYNAAYKVPLVNLDWTDLAAYTASRNAHFAAIAAGADAVYDRSTGKLTVTAPVAGQITVTGAKASGHTTYGKDVTSVLAIKAGRSSTVATKLRS
jgi:hypothetical protein